MIVQQQNNLNFKSLPRIGRALLFLSFFCLLWNKSIAQFHERIDSLMLLEYNTCKEQSFLNKEEKEIICIVNFARKEPQAFVRLFLRPYKESYNGDISYYFSAESRLQHASSLGLLEPDKSLYNLASSHAKDLGKKGKVGHQSSDGESFRERIGSLTKNFELLLENCDYGSFEALDVVMSLIIDEGVENYGHRENILNKEINCIGVAYSEHKKYRHSYVMDFGKIKG